eukprot:TRINITY_DN825_c0_g2_i1.p1 TRINITY_DN825_c0_g2~~TRINITY_DN825_c0_g2_i1.p1  ORF type:complete len:818 (+),score=219.76 TRINITY_DN825_c0_g2_i1:57-2456(+)
MTTLLMMYAVIGAVSPKLEWRSGMMSRMFDMAVDGTTTYVATGPTGLQVLDTSNPAHPAPLGWYATRNALSVDVSGTTAYVADTEEGLLVLDVSTPSKPVLLGGEPAASGSYVRVSGSVAYVARVGTDSGVVAVDVSDTSSPSVLGAYTDPGYPSMITVEGTTVFSAVYSTVLVIDFSTPSAPALLSRFSGVAYCVEVANGLAYVGTMQGVDTYNVSSLAAPHRIASFRTPSAAYNIDIQVAGQIAYVVAQDEGLLSIDVDEATDPKLLGNVMIEDAKLVRVAGGATLVGTTTPSSVVVVDVANPVLLKVVGVFAPASGARKVHTVGDIAYVADQVKGLLVYNVSKGAEALVGSYVVDGAQAVYAVGTTVYLCGGRFYVLDATTPSLVTLLGASDEGSWAWDVQVVGTTAYLSLGCLTVLDVSRPSAIKLLGKSTCGQQHWAPRGLKVSGNTACVTSFQGSLAVIDVSTPSAPALLRSYSTNVSSWAVDVVGTIAFVGTDAGMEIINISSATTGHLATFPTSERVFDVQVEGTVAFLAVQQSGLQLVDVSHLSAPALMGEYPTGGPQGVFVQGNAAFLADVGLWVFALTAMAPTPPAPTLLVPVPGSTTVIKGVFGNADCGAFFADAILVDMLKDLFAELLLLEVAEVHPSYACGSVVYVVPVSGGVVPAHPKREMTRLLNEQPELSALLGTEFTVNVAKVGDAECELPGAKETIALTKEVCVALSCTKGYTLSQAHNKTSSVCKPNDGGDSNNKDYLYVVIPIVCIVACAIAATVAFIVYRRVTEQPPAKKTVDFYEE